MQLVQIGVDQIQVEMIDGLLAVEIEIAVEIERALLGHLQRAVGFHLGLDIHLRHGVRFRVSLPGSQRHKRACERQERRAKQHGVSSGKSEGFAELRTAHVLHDHAPCNLEVVTVS